MEGLYLDPRRESVEGFLDKYGEEVDQLSSRFPDWSHYVCFFTDETRSYARVCYNSSELRKVLELPLKDKKWYTMLIKHVRQGCNAQDFKRELGL